MCGIFGYIGNKNNAPRIVLKGLKTLEYRGYDSWGIAAKQDIGIGRELKIHKHIGKIDNKSINSKFIHQKSSIAIGHTRWATHGGVTVQNAHPHLSCNGNLAVVHNGIVENYEELKKYLLKKGHKFLSETDTEVIPHLIEENLKKYSLNNSVRLAFNLLKGLSAIVVLDLISNSIIAAKNGSPLILGIGINEFFVASDLTGIVPYTRTVVYIKDNEMLAVDKAARLYSLPGGKKIPFKTEIVNDFFEDSTLGEYKHFMMKEISQQPKVISNIIEGFGSEAKRLIKALKNSKKVYAIAAGTAHHASIAGMYLFSRLNNIDMRSVVASEFNLVMPFIDKKSLVIAFSQSGETIDVIEPLNNSIIKGANVAALVNSLGSSIYRMADIKLQLLAGPEKAVASTKAYIAKLTLLLLFSYSMNNKEKQIVSQLNKASYEIKKMLKEPFVKKIKYLARLLKNSKNIYLIGRGISYQSALEGALKIKEISYIPTEALPGGELKHGTLALIENNVPCIVFAPNDETYSHIISNAIEIKTRGGYIIGISHKNSTAFDYWIPVKYLQEATILTQIVPLQLLAYYLALERGIDDPDKPRNLAKSVTVK